jgi:hypothetical protein
MNAIRTIGLVSLIAFCVTTAIAQNASTPTSTIDISSKKEKFELGLEMLKGYRADLQDRFEKSAALLIIVIGWLITSDTARKSIGNNSLLFWGGVTILTALIVMYCSTIYHFIERYREIQRAVETLGYTESPYFARYQLPDKIFSMPVHFSYIAPIFPFYIFILLILFQIKYQFIPLPKAPNDAKEKN